MWQHCGQHYWTTVNSTPSPVILAYPHPLPQPPYLLIEAHLFVLLILLVLLFYSVSFVACLFYSVSFFCLSVLFCLSIHSLTCLSCIYLFVSLVYSVSSLFSFLFCSPVCSHICLFPCLFCLSICSSVLVKCDPFSSLLSFHYSLHLLYSQISWADLVIGSW